MAAKSHINIAVLHKGSVDHKKAGRGGGGGERQEEKKKDAFES